jgi:hypothetical protein
MYGETLHSGQVSDRASPATGDYVRSDMSEEPEKPHAHGRSTRAANRGTTNGRPSNRPLDSEEEEDATSWDGGDEDEDEPEQMDLDDEENEQGEDSSEDDEEPQTLMVTLRYGKGSVKQSSEPAPSNETVPEPASVNGVAHNGIHAEGAALAGIGAPRQAALVEPQPSSIPATIVPEVKDAPAAPVPNGVPVPFQPTSTAAVVPTAQHPQAVSNPIALPQAVPLNGQTP